MGFYSELLAITGAAVSILAALFALVRTLLRVTAERQLIKRALERKSLEHIENFLDLSNSSFLGELSRDQIEQVRHLLEDEARTLPGAKRKVLEEGLEQPSELGRSDYTKKLLSESRKTLAAR